MYTSLVVAALSASAIADEPNDQFGDSLPKGAIARAGTIRLESDLPPGFAVPSSVRGVLFSPDGKLLASRGEPGDPKAARVIRLWNAADGKLLRTIAAFDEPLASFVFTADSKQLISSTPEHPQGTQVWNVADGGLVRSLPGGKGELSLSVDGRSVAVVDRFGSKDVIRTFDLQTGVETNRAVVDGSYQLAFGPQSRAMLSRKSERDPLLRLFDVTNGKTRAELNRNAGQLGAMTIAPTGQSVAVTVTEREGRQTDELIVLWEVATERPAYDLSGFSKRELALAFSPDGRYLISGGLDRVVRVWEVATGKQVHEFSGHNGPISTLQVSPDGTRVASGSFDRTVLIWDMSAVTRSFLPADPLDKEVFARVWDELGAESPSNAYRAIGQLRQHEAIAIDMLHQQIESIVRPIDAEQIRKLIADLEHEDYVVRFRATMELLKKREAARPLLVKTAKETTSAEVRYRIRRVLTTDDDTPLFDDADHRRIARVIHAVEYFPGEKAEATLQAIIDDFPNESLAAAAKETLERMRTP